MRAPEAASQRSYEGQAAVSGRAVASRSRTLRTARPGSLNWMTYSWVRSSAEVFSREGVQLGRLERGPASGAGGSARGTGEQGGDLHLFPVGGLDGPQERDVGVGCAARGPGGAAGFERGDVVEQGGLDVAVLLGDVGGGE